MPARRTPSPNGAGQTPPYLAERQRRRRRLHDFRAPNLSAARRRGHRLPLKLNAQLGRTPRSASARLQRRPARSQTAGRPLQPASLDAHLQQRRELWLKSTRRPISSGENLTISIDKNDGNGTQAQVVGLVGDKLADVAVKLCGRRHDLDNINVTLTRRQVEPLSKDGRRRASPCRAAIPRLAALGLGPDTTALNSNHSSFTTDSRSRACWTTLSPQAARLPTATPRIPGQRRRRADDHVRTERFRG